MIKWNDIVATGFQDKKKSDPTKPSFLIITTKKKKSDMFFKQTQFKCTLPYEDKDEIQKIIKTNIDNYRKMKLIKKHRKT